MIYCLSQLCQVQSICSYNLGWYSKNSFLSPLKFLSKIGTQIYVLITILTNPFSQKGFFEFTTSREFFLIQSIWPLKHKSWVSACSVSF